jgi:hypothetical protein
VYHYYFVAGYIKNLPKRLKGNPVKIRSYPRSCEVEFSNPPKEGLRNVSI